MYDKLQTLKCDRHTKLSEDGFCLDCAMNMIKAEPLGPLLRPQTVPSKIHFKNLDCKVQQDKCKSAENDSDQRGKRSDAKLRRVSRSYKERHNETSATTFAVPQHLDPERLKADIYRQYIGRKNASDKGIKNKKNKNSKSECKQPASKKTSVDIAIDKCKQSMDDLEEEQDSGEACTFKSTGGMMKTIKKVSTYLFKSIFVLVVKKFINLFSESKLSSFFPS